MSYGYGSARRFVRCLHPSVRVQCMISALAYQFFLFFCRKLESLEVRDEAHDLIFERKKKKLGRIRMAPEYLKMAQNEVL